MPSQYGYQPSSRRPAQDTYSSPSRSAGKRTQYRVVKARRMMLQILYIAFAIAMTLFIFKSPFFYIRREKISGLSELTSTEANKIVQMASIPEKTNLFLVKSSHIQKALCSLPFIHAVNIRKLPPGTLILHLFPRMPVAALICPDGQWEIDGAGDVIRPLVHKNLPWIQLTSSIPVTIGQPVNNPGVLGGILILNQYKSDGNPGISKIEVDQNGDICLNMQDHISIKLGPADQLISKIATLERIYQLDRDIASRVQSINLTCNDALACTPRGKSNSKKTGMTTTPAIPTQSSLGRCNGNSLPATRTRG